MNWISVEDRLPTHEGPFIACSMHPQRDDFNQNGEFWDNGRKVEGGEVMSLLHVYHVENNLWSHALGGYDHGITNWVEYVCPPTK